MKKDRLKTMEPRRSPLLVLAAVCFTAAAVFALPAVMDLFDAEAMGALLYRIARSGVVDRGAQRFWLIVYCCLDILSLICAGAMALSLWLTCIPNRDGEASSAGLTLLIYAAKVMLYAVIALALLLIVLYVYNVLRYIIRVKDLRDNVLLIAGMVASEGLLGTVAVIALSFVMAFLRKADTTLVSVQYTVITGKPDPRNISVFVPVMLVVFSAVAVKLAVDNMGDTCSVLKYLLAAVGNVLTGAFLYRYKIHMERVLFEETRKDEELPG